MGKYRSKELKRKYLLNEKIEYNCGYCDGDIICTSNHCYDNPSKLKCNCYKCKRELWRWNSWFKCINCNKKWSNLPPSKEEVKNLLINGEIRSKRRHIKAIKNDEYWVPDMKTYVTLDKIQIKIKKLEESLENYIRTKKEKIKHLKSILKSGPGKNNQGK